MRVLKEVIGKRVEFGGEEHTGWLPLNSVVPQPTSIENAIVDVRILEEGSGGFILEWVSPDAYPPSDSWHATIEEAEGEAKDQFGIEASEWKSPGGDI
jgi:hypothetical protein